MTVHAGGAASSTSAYDARQSCNRYGDEGEVGFLQGFTERRRGLDGTAFGGELEDGGVLVPSDDRSGLVGSARGESRRGPDQARPDDG